MRGAWVAACKTGIPNITNINRLKCHTAHFTTKVCYLYVVSYTSRQELGADYSDILLWERGTKVARI